MSIITSQNWDGVTPPTIPSGWTVSTGLVTTSSACTSTPNSLGSSSPTFSGTTAAVWGTVDSNSGNVAVQSSLYLGANGTANRWGLFARASKSPLIRSSIFYALWLENQASPSSPTLTISLTDHGSESALTGATVPISRSITAGWYTAFFVLSGSTLTGSLQRQSDGAWLGSNGSWGASQVTAISVLDSSLAGSGYSGLLLNGTLAGSMYSDDFALSTAPAPVSLTASTVAVSGAGTLSTATAAVGSTLPGSVLSAPGTMPIPTPLFAYALGTSSLTSSALLSATLVALGTTSVVTAVSGTSLLPVETVLYDWTVPAISAASSGSLASATLGTGTTLPANPLGMSAVLAAVTPGLGTTLPPSLPLAGSSLLTSPTTVLGSGVTLSAGLPLTGSGLLTTASTLLGSGTTLPTSSPLSGSGSLTSATTVVGLGVGVAATTLFDVLAVEPSALILYDCKLSCLVNSAMGGVGTASLQVSGTEIVATSSLIACGSIPVASMLSSQSGVVYNLYRNDGSGGPIDYTNPIATTSETSWSSGTLSYPGDWKFGVRAYQLGNALEEQNLDAAIELILDGTGVDVSSRPFAPSGLRAIPRAAGAIRVEWGYHSMNRSWLPLGFNVYIGVGGTPNYASPASSAAYVLGGTSYLCDLTGLVSGTTYTVGVRAYNAAGEETNTSTVAITSDATGPQGVDTLTGTPTATQGD